MKRTVDPNSNDALLDRLLDQHLADRSEQLAPSSGFVASVMESIQAEAAAPPPIAFPWRRVLPGALAAVCGLIVLVVLVLRGGTASAVQLAGPTLRAWHSSLLPCLLAGETVLCWSLVAACISVGPSRHPSALPDETNKSARVGTKRMTSA